MLNVYALYDVKSQSFADPFYAVNNYVAMRILAGVICEGDSYIAKFPEDYRCYKLGEFDDKKGKLIPLEVIEILCDMSAVALSLSTAKERSKKGLQIEDEDSESEVVGNGK